jgi:endonuclease/exonuclease/phosphatase family metal-dependent hydrolase
VSDRVRVLTANLWNGGADPEGFAELVRSLEADVVCVQELSPEQAEALSRALPHGRLEPARNHDGQGIALRRPATLRRLALPQRDAHVAQLDPTHWPGLAAPLEVVAVHIMGPHVPPLARSWPVRRGQFRGLLRYLDEAPPLPRALVGDLNATPLWPLYRHLNATPLWPLYRRLARRLQDAPHQVARRRGARPSRTWGPWPGAPRLLRIDHALVSRVAVEEALVVAVPGGDHSALVVDLAPDPEADAPADAG